MDRVVVVDLMRLQGRIHHEGYDAKSGKFDQRERCQTFRGISSFDQVGLSDLISAEFRVIQ